MGDNTRKKERALVTGGGGFLGKAIVRMLVGRGDEVTSLSRQFYQDLEQWGVRQVQGDLYERELVEMACKGQDVVYHVAAKAGVWGDYHSYFNTNVTGTRNVIDSCLITGVSRLIYTSSPSVVFDGTDMEGIDETVPYPDVYLAPYPKTKAMAEQQVIKASKEQLKGIILRPHLIWGPEDNHLVPTIIERASKLKRIGNGKNLVDTIYIDNAAHAHLLAADCLRADASLSGSIYFISQDDPIPLWEMIDHFLDAAGLPPIRGQVSFRAAWIAGTIFETLFKAFKLDKMPPMTRFVAKELATAHWFDISKAKTQLGYQPIVSTKEGLERLKDWLISTTGSTG